MIKSGQRRDGNPIILQSNGKTIRPERISFSQKTFDEGWLQELIRANPELLPTDEIESIYSPLVSIGREVPTKAGPIDNLYISPQGYLTIVETKLWRNPEARRKVLGQIIDYAKEVKGWTYNNLDERVRSYNQKHRGANLSILETLQLELGSIEEEYEAFFIDLVSENLRQGRFLLLVVGDGIHESVEEMAEFLTQTPQLHFTLALVELQVYEYPDNSLLVVPQIVTRTKEIIRAVVEVKAKGIESISVGLVEPTSSEPEDVFFDALNKNVGAEQKSFARIIMQDLENLNCVPEWHGKSCVMKLPDPKGSRKRFSIVGVYKSGEVFVGALADQLKKVGFSDQIGFDYAARTASLFKGCKVRDDNPAYWKNDVPLKDVQQKYSDFKSIVQETIDKIYEAAENS